MSSFANEESDDELWLKAHRQQFKSDEFVEPDASWKPKERRRRRRRSSPKLRPLSLSGVRKYCPTCGEQVAMETLRSGKCMICQIADFLD